MIAPLLRQRDQLLGHLQKRQASLEGVFARMLALVKAEHMWLTQQ
jgi:hypothetical protein